MTPRRPPGRSGSAPPGTPPPSPDAPQVFGHVIETDMERCVRRAIQLAEQTARFRQWVLTRCTMPDGELDDVVRDTADQVWRHFDCVTCGRCCRLDTVSVDDADVARLARRFAVGPKRFSERYVHVVDGERGLRAAPCPFLRSGLCSVYDDRPRACREFPFLHTPGFRGRVLVLMEFSTLCPIIYNTLEALKRRLEWRRPA